MPTVPAIVAVAPHLNGLERVVALLGGSVGSGLFALAGVAAGGILTHFLSLRREREARDHVLIRERLRIMQDRGEELYSLLHQWSQLSTAPFFFYRQVMAGEIDYNDALDAIAISHDKLRGPFERIWMIIDVYYPQLKSGFDAVRDDITISNTIEADFRKGYKSGQLESSEHKASFEAFLVRAERKMKETKTQLAIELRKQFAGK